jgi:SAM-dependent methyltransferase
MGDWYEHYPENLWLQADDTGREDAQFIVSALRLGLGDRVLDAPCGAGRVAVHLARTGCKVTCLDLNPRFIARAKQRFASEGLVGEFRAMDLQCLNDHERFDAVCNWGGSFGYWADDENADVLRRLAAALKPGGRLLIDQPNREWLLRHFVRETRVKDHTVRTRWDAVTQRVESTWHADAQEEPCGFSSIRIYTPAQFRRLLTGAGLTWETAYGGKDGSPHSRSSRRVVVVATKNP